MPSAASTIAPTPHDLRPTAVAEADAGAGAGVEAVVAMAINQFGVPHLPQSSGESAY